MKRFILMMLCLPILAVGQNLQKLSALTGAACDHVHHHGEFLLVGAGHTFMVQRFAGESHPFPEMFRRRFVSSITAIEVRGNDMYLAANHDGVYKFNITDPTNPVEVAHYELDEITEAAYDIAFKGDSLFIPCRTKVKIIRDEGNSFTWLADFALQTGNSLSRGGEIIGNVFAHGQAMGGATDGIYLYDATTLQQLGFYEQTYGEPEDFVLGTQIDVIHVLGGTQSWSNPANPNGLFYTLDISDPSQPEALFIDTIPGWPLGLGIASPIDAVNRNDTIFVATTCALDPDWVLGQPATGQIMVYDASDTSDVHLSTTLYGGLWHFGVDVLEDTLFVASEWYGVMTVDISDLHNEVEIGRTLTGGWNTSAAKHGNRLAVPLGGYGFEIYDISDPTNPELQTVNYDPFFVRSLEWSEDGNHLFAFYVSNDNDLLKFRAYDSNTMDLVGQFNTDVGWRRTWRWQNKIAVMREATLGATKLSVIDVSDPSDPTIDTTFTYNFNDMALNEDGYLFVSHNDSLSVFNLANGFDFVTSLQDAAWWNSFEALATTGDTVYCWVTSQGLTRYLFDGTSLTEDGIFTLDHEKPEYMAADQNGLYMSVLQEGLFAHDLNTLSETGYYQHGLEMLSTAHWGVWDLVAEDGLIFLSEWHGNVTILTNDDNLVSSESNNFDQPGFTFQNPSTGYIRLTNSGEQGTLNVYNSNGALVLSERVNRGYNLLRTELNSGIYILELGAERSKMIVTE